MRQYLSSSPKVGYFNHNWAKSSLSCLSGFSLRSFLAPWGVGCDGEEPVPNVLQNEAHGSRGHAHHFPSLVVVHSRYCVPCPSFFSHFRVRSSLFSLVPGATANCVSIWLSWCRLYDHYGSSETYWELMRFIVRGLSARGVESIDTLFVNAMIWTGDARRP